MINPADILIYLHNILWFSFFFTITVITAALLGGVIVVPLSSNETRDGIVNYLGRLLFTASMAFLGLALLLIFIPTKETVTSETKEQCEVQE